MNKFLFPTFLALCLFIFLVSKIKQWTKENEAVIETPATLLQVMNDSKDTALVYVTLGATPGCVQNVLEIPFVTDTVPGQNGMQGYFSLLPGDSTIAYANSLGLNGVISFGFPPSNCPDSLNYPNGLNQFEFILNNSFQGENAQETIDISCVHGVNCVIRVDLKSLNMWNAGPTLPNIQSFANTMNRSHIGIAGVFPYGCDTCTGSKTPPSCIQLPQPKQTQSICNVQRNASQSGGTVKVIYQGKSNIN